MSGGTEMPLTLQMGRIITAVTTLTLTTRASVKLGVDMKEKRKGSRRLREKERMKGSKREIL